MRQALHRLALIALALLGACASPPPPPTPEALAPAQWQAALPPEGASGELSRWWQQFNDPLLSQLIAAAQNASPTLADAASRIAQSRALRVAAGAALLPDLSANASAARGRQDLTLPEGSIVSAGLQASWEIDLFGANRAARAAAQARLEAAQAAWYAAHVALAAEVASSYLGLRSCEALRVQAELDAGSRAESARLTELSAQAGFQSPAHAALTRASAAQSKALLTAQRALCDLQVKALVALSAWDEAALRSALQSGTARLPEPAQISVQSVPAQVLAQRPDVFAAERELLATSADLRQTQAARLPRISLAGAIGVARVSADGLRLSGDTWAIGPLSVTLPLFDAGSRAANVAAARARFDAAGISYRAQLRTAVREVEEALVQLQSTAERSDDAHTAAEGFASSFQATEVLYQGGLASLFELEDARRQAVQAQRALIDWQRERVAAWITLYRVLGGGWTPDEAQPAQASTDAAPLPTR